MNDKRWGLAVKAIVTDDNRQVLVLQRSAHSARFAGTWEFPGGKVDAGEDFDAALLREVAEETGLIIALEKVAGATHYEMPAIRLAVLFVEARLVSGQVRLSNEHDDYRWVPLTDLTRLDMSEQLHEFVQDYVTWHSGSNPSDR